MTDQLPPNLRALFTARPALKYLPAHDHAQEERCTRHISGVAAFLPQLEAYKATDVYNATESHHQRQTRLKEEKKANHKALIENAPTAYKPTADPNITGDAYKTLFISRLDYGIEEKDLRKVFATYGNIENIRLIKNAKGKSAGYAFILYGREDDMKAAYKDTDGISIKGRRVCVDVERGRTVTGWKPRRFGGGLGGRHYTRGPMQAPQMGRGGPPAGPGGFGRGGGFQGRGGFGGGRGGFRGDFGGGRGGGFRGDRGGYGGGGRGGIGYQSNGFGAPNGAPSGPRGGGRGGGFQGGSGGYGRDRSYDDRRGGGMGGGGNSSGSNREPVGQRGSGGGYRDRDRDGGGYGGGRDDRKRGYDDDGYDANRNKRRY